MRNNLFIVLRHPLYKTSSLQVLYLAVVLVQVHQASCIDELCTHNYSVLCVWDPERMSCL